MTLEIPKFIGASATLATEIHTISKMHPQLVTDWTRIRVTRDSDKHMARFHQLASSGALLPEVFIYIRVGTKNSLTHLQVMRLANVTVSDFKISGETEEIEFDTSKLTTEDISMTSPAALETVI